MVVVNLAAEEARRALDHAPTPCNGAEQVVPRMIPDRDVRRAAFAVLQRIGALPDRRIFRDASPEQCNLFFVEEGTLEHVTVVLKTADILFRYGWKPHDVAPAVSGRFVCRAALGVNKKR